MSIDWPRQPDGRVWLYHEPCLCCDEGWLVATSVIEGKMVFRCTDCGALYTLNKEALRMANDTLVNGDFEGTFSTRGAPELVVADGWEPWFVKERTRPEWKRELEGIGKGRVLSGSGQKMFTLNALHDAGIWQRVNVQAGAWYEFTAQMYVWCSEEDDPDKSVRPGNYHAMVGANSWGHWPTHYATVWGREIGLDRYNTWTQAAILFQAWHSTVSLIVRGFNEWASKHNDLYVDNCTFRQVELYVDEQPPAPPDPGQPVEVDYERIASMTAERTLGLLTIHQVDLASAVLLHLQGED